MELLLHIRPEFTENVARHLQAQPQASILEDANWVALMRCQVERARALMLHGAPLALALPGRLGWELRLIVHGGLRILARIEAAGYDVFRQRPTLGSRDWLAIGRHALFYRLS